MKLFSAIVVPFIRFVGHILGMLSAALVIMLLPIMYFYLQYKRSSSRLSVGWSQFVLVLEIIHAVILCICIYIWPWLLLSVILAAYLFTYEPYRLLVDAMIDYNKDPMDIYVHDNKFTCEDEWPDTWMNPDLDDE